MLNFTALDLGGNLFTANSVPLADRPILLSFDYLGLGTSGSDPDDTGGMLRRIEFYRQSVGRSRLWAGRHVPARIAGLGRATRTLSSSSMTAPGITMRSMSRPSSRTVNGLQGAHFMFEDWADSGGVAGDVYFDSIRVFTRSTRLTPVPESDRAVVMGILLVGGMAVHWLVRRRATRARAHRNIRFCVTNPG